MRLALITEELAMLCIEEKHAAIRNESPLNADSLAM
jgi:hypothetical protein